MPGGAWLGHCEGRPLEEVKVAHVGLSFQTDGCVTASCFLPVYSLASCLIIGPAHLHGPRPHDAIYQEVMETRKPLPEAKQVGLPNVGFPKTVDCCCCYCYYYCDISQLSVVSYTCNLSTPRGLDRGIAASLQPAWDTKTGSFEERAKEKRKWAGSSS